MQLWHANLFKDLRNPNEFGRFFIDLQWAIYSDYKAAKLAKD